MNIILKDTPATLRLQDIIGDIGNRYGVNFRYTDGNVVGDFVDEGAVRTYNTERHPAIGRHNFEALAMNEWADAGGCGDWAHVAACMYAVTQILPLSSKEHCDIFDDATFLCELARRLGHGSTADHVSRIAAGGCEARIHSLPAKNHLITTNLYSERP